MNKSYPVDLHNPFTDKTEAVFCEFYVHTEKGKISLDITSITTQADIEIVDYLSETEKDKIIEHVMEKFGGEI